MRRTRRSVWHDRDPVALASKSGRPRSCPQWLWYWATPERKNGAYWYQSNRPNGWVGGRDRDKPRKSAWHLYVRGEWVGGVMQYSLRDAYTAYVNDDGGDVVKRFTRRRDAKRWVEVEAARRGER